MTDSHHRPRLTLEGSPASAPDRSILTEEDMRALAARFPSTADFGRAPWDPDALDAWAAALWGELSESFDPVFAEEAEEGGAAGLPPAMAGLATARFLLRLWDPRRPWRCGEPDLMQALLCVWDDAHRDAFLGWAQAPRCR